MSKGGNVIGLLGLLQLLDGVRRTSPMAMHLANKKFSSIADGPGEYGINAVMKFNELRDQLNKLDPKEVDTVMISVIYRTPESDGPCPDCGGTHKDGTNVMMGMVGLPEDLAALSGLAFEHIERSC